MLDKTNVSQIPYPETASINMQSINKALLVEIPQPYDKRLYTAHGTLGISYAQRDYHCVI